MRRFLSSAWYPFLIAVLLAGVTVAAYAILKPTGEDIGNGQIQEAMTYAGWAAGPIAGLVALIIAGLLNLIRRIVKLRRKNLLHPIVVFLSVLPWFVISWQISGEEAYTPIARGIIPFVARPLLWGSLVALIATIVLALPLLFPKKK